MSLADQLRAEPIPGTRADFNATLRKIYEAGQKIAARRCLAICQERAFSEDAALSLDRRLEASSLAEAIDREFRLTKAKP
jgi:hypothetical protein